MNEFNLTIRMSGYAQPIKESIMARHQNEARAKAKAMYKNCKVVSCVKG